MNLLVSTAFVIVASFATVKADLPYCKPCTDGFAQLALYLIQEPQLERQVEVLGAFICEDQTCNDAITKWWPAMAR